MKNIVTIFRKQLKETMRNKEVLIQFLMFPALAVFMTKSIQIEGMPPNFFVQLFSTMYVGMAPLVSMEAILSEEKEKNTLRVLLMADVTPWQYLAGVGGYVFLFCMLGAGVFCLLGGYRSGEAVLFLAVLGAGILVSMLLGAAIGAGSSSQMAANSVGVPLMLLLSFLPMLSLFNAHISKVTGLVYTEQIRRMLTALGEGEAIREGLLVIGGSFLLFGGFFVWQYRGSLARDKCLSHNG